MAALAQLANIAYRTPNSETFPGDEAANRLLRRAYSHLNLIFLVDLA